jgi:hypothetical protein
MADPSSYEAVISLHCGIALALYTTHRAHTEHESNEWIVDKDAEGNILKLEEILARSCLDQLAKKVCPVKHAYPRQVLFYMRYIGGGETTVRHFDMHLN